MDRIRMRAQENKPINLITFTFEGLKQAITVPAAHVQEAMSQLQYEFLQYVNPNVLGDVSVSINGHKYN